jgi:hypothetical protein
MARKIVMRADRQARRRWRAAFDDLWLDRPTRVGVIAAAIALWLAVTLVEPWFLVLFMSAAWAVKLRVDRRPPQTPVDDWE